MKNHQQYGTERKRRRKEECVGECVVPIRQWGNRTFIALATAVLLCGCTGSSPDIVEMMQTIVFRHDPALNQSFEALHLYTVVTDSDGIGDLSELYVLNDDQALFWKLNKDSWDTYEVADRVWIGSHTLRMPQSRVIPRGLYRVQVYDRAGELDAQSVEILQSNSIENTSFTFPSLEYENGIVNLSSIYEDNILRWYYHGNDEIFEYRGAAGEIDLRELAPHLSPSFESNKVAIEASSSFYIYSFPVDNDNNDYYILVGPIMVQ